jgi:hypothetical protein
MHTITPTPASAHVAGSGTAATPARSRMPGEVMNPAIAE